jgi:hypothetical protein
MNAKPFILKAVSQPNREPIKVAQFACLRVCVKCLGKCYTEFHDTRELILRDYTKIYQDLSAFICIGEA